MTGRYPFISNNTTKMVDGIMEIHPIVKDILVHPYNALAGKQWVEIPNPKME